jgi:hypothetical protein
MACPGRPETDSHGGAFMADEQLIRGDCGSESQRTSKTSSEFRKTESESREIERGAPPPPDLEYGKCDTQ